MKQKESGLKDITDGLCKLVTGLTGTELKRLEQLKKELSPKKKHRRETAQDTIRFEKMYEDGVCLVEKEDYSMMVEFYDVNYGLFDVDQQTQILN